MTIVRRRVRRRVRWAAALAIGVIVVGAGVAWLAWRTRPEAIGSRFADAVVARFAGASVDTTVADLPRVQTATGVLVDVRLAPVVDACGLRRTACGAAIDDAVADVGRVVAAVAAPRPELLRPMVLAEAVPGFRLGYVAESVVQPLELRHALVVGVASTFVTPAIADRLGMTTAGLRSAADAWLAREPGATLERLDGAPGEAPLYRVRASGDPVASLIDGARLERFATQLGTRRLYVAVPARGVLYVAPGDAAGLRALRNRSKRPFGAPLRPGEAGVLACDVDAPAAARFTFPTSAS